MSELKQIQEEILGKQIPLEKLIQSITSVGGSFALFRLPGESTLYQLQLSFSSLQPLDDQLIEELGEGFVFASFDGPKYFLRADISWSSSSELLTFDSTQLTDDFAAFSDAVEHSESKKLNLYKSENRLEYHSEKEFIQLVDLCKEYISEGVFEKVVPSRSTLIKGIVESDCLEAFEDLCQTYSNAFVSLFSSPDTGTWLGATPELLVRSLESRYFETASLAGTQPYHDQVLSDVAWTQKEIEEQALVSRYVINCFKKIRLREFAEKGPKTVIAGNILHLKTVFSVDMAVTNFPQLSSTMLKLLHPTSAVCGMPLETSRDFLKSNENLNRSFYSGFLGPINTNSNTHVFVNLRCLELIESGALLYAGAGVTIDSNPQKELEETELKFDTLRKILRPGESH